jgi:hypothetical protein
MSAAHDPVSGSAEPPGLRREVPAALLGRPSAVVQVAQRREGEGEALRPTGEELVDDGQVVTVLLPHRLGPGDALEAGGGEGGGDLDVGVAAVREAAEQLHDVALVEDDRGVRLLHLQHPGPLDLDVGGDVVEHGDGELGVVHGVVGVGRPLDGGDVAHVGVDLALEEHLDLLGWPDPDEELVAGGAVGVLDLGDDVQQARPLVAQRRRRPHRERTGGGAATGEPPLAREVGEEELLEVVGRDHGISVVVVGPSVRENQ